MQKKNSTYYYQLPLSFKHIMDTGKFPMNKALSQAVSEHLRVFFRTVAGSVPLDYEFGVGAASAGDTIQQLEERIAQYEPRLSGATVRLAPADSNEPFHQAILVTGLLINGEEYEGAFLLPMKSNIL